MNLKVDFYNVGSVTTAAAEQAYGHTPVTFLQI